MRDEPLAGRELDGDGPECLRRRARDAQHAAALLEIVDAERRREARGPTRRQNMVGPCAVVAERLARIVADEDRAGMPDLGQQRVGIGNCELEMLRRDAVRDGAGLVEIARANERAAAGDTAIRLERFWKSYTPSGEEKRALPEVGRTWLGPAQ